MSTGWVVDLRHFLAPSGALAETSAPARRLAENIYSLTDYARPWVKALERFGVGAGDGTDADVALMGRDGTSR